MRRSSFALTFCLILLASAGPAFAQEREVPYWAAIRAEEVNMRKGPGAAFPIDWVYRRPGLPVKVMRVMQGWRLARDPDGTQGWIVGRLLTLDRGAIVTGEELAEMRDSPDESADLLWNVEPGVVGRLGECENGWCEFDVDGRAGWISEARIWGAGEP